MPCYIRGRIEVKDIEMFKSALKDLDYSFNEGQLSIKVYKDNRHIGTLNLYNNTFNYLRTSLGTNSKNILIQKYSEKQIRKIARQKGWSIDSVKQDEKQLKIKLSQ